MAQSGSSPGEGPTCVTGNLSRSSRGLGIARFLTSCATVLDNPGCGRVGKGVDPAHPRRSTDLDGGSMASRPISAYGPMYTRVMLRLMCTHRYVFSQSLSLVRNLYRSAAGLDGSACSSTANGRLRDPPDAKVLQAQPATTYSSRKSVLTKEPYLSLSD